MPSDITDVLTTDEWAAARAKYEAGTHSYQALSDEMGFSKAYIGRRGKKEGWFKLTSTTSSTVNKVTSPKPSPIAPLTMSKVNGNVAGNWLENKPSVMMQALTEKEEEIMVDVVNGESMQKIANTYGVSRAMIGKWIAADEARVAAFAQARRLSAEAFDEQAEEGIRGSRNAFELAIQRELAIHLRWRSKARDPRTYGDKQQVELSGTVKTEMSDEELNARIAALTKDMGNVVDVTPTDVDDSVV